MGSSSLVEPDLLAEPGVDGQVGRAPVMAENQRVLGMIARRWPGARHDRSAAYLTIHARLG